MKRFFRKTVFFILTVAIAASLMPVTKAAAYTAPYSTVRIGIFYGSTALKSANLQNEVGSGFEFGYYNSDRDFVSLGAYTSQQKITMIVDKNMVYNSAENSYSEGASGSVVVGCYHIRLNTAYASVAEASAAAGTFTSVDSFVKYANGTYYVMVGSYTSSAAATAAAGSLNLSQGYTIDSGTAYTVTVVRTGSSDILFEFDCGAERSLGIRPRASANGSKTETWFKGYRWNGGFQYSRISGGNITVVNFVNIEDYIKGVIPYEMSASWPAEALKAQSVCARTYVMYNLNKHKSSGFDVCNTTDCQVYYGRGSANSNSDAAVEATAGEYLTYNGSLCETYYHAADGGYTENSENVWSVAHPYLRAVEDIYETSIADSIANYYWTRQYTGEQLAQRLRTRGYSCSTIIKFEILEFTAAGNVYRIRFTDSAGKTFTFTKEYCRTVPGASSQRYTVASSSQGAAVNGGVIYVNSPSGTLSSGLSGSSVLGSSGRSDAGLTGSVYAITGTGSIETVEGGTVSVPSGSSSNPTFVISGTGSGHNVGMSQRGAYAMAKNYNKSYVDILTFYYQGTAVSKSGVN